MESVAIKGKLCVPNGKPEEVVINLNDESLDNVKNGILKLQATMNKILTDKIEMEKLKEPAEKKQKTT